MSHDYLRRFRPTLTQTALLRAALLDGDPARAAYAEWRRGLVLDDIEMATHRLLPLLAENLGRLGIVDPDQPRLRGIRRRQLYRNRLLLHAAQPIMGRLAAAGIPVLLLKGSAICATVRRDWSLRYLSDIDIVVPPLRALEAWTELEKQGWRDVTRRFNPADRARIIDSFHSIGFCDPRGAEIDLHWRTLAQLEHPNQEEAFWRDSVVIDSMDLPARAPSREHLLFHVLAHAVFGFNGNSIDWVPDAYAILTLPQRPIVWNDVIQFARERAIARILGAQLAWLREQLGAPVPPEVVIELSASPTVWTERTLGVGTIHRYAGLWLLQSRWHDRRNESIIIRIARVAGDLARYYQVPIFLLPAVGIWRAGRSAIRALWGRRMNHQVKTECNGETVTE